MKAHFLDRGSFPFHIRINPPAAVTKWVEFDQTTSDQCLTHCQNAEIILTNKVVLTRHHLEQLPDLKLICVTATGYNNIDIEACRDFGIKVVNATNYGTQSVSEHVLMLMLNLARNLPAYLSANESKSWSKSDFFCDMVAPIQQLHGKTLTIVGRGTLGNAVADLARAFAMQVIFAEHRRATFVRSGYVPFNEALARADFLSLHCPLTPATEHLINHETLALLKPTAYLINTGRGPLVNEADLLDALKNQVIAGAALDVAQAEPPSENDLIWQLATQPNVIVTPHIAWAADESMQTLIDQIMAKVDQFLTGELKEDLTHNRT